MDRVYEDAKAMVEHEIDIIVKKEEISPTDLENLDKFIDIAKDICEMDSYDEMKREGFSGRMNYASYGTMPYYNYGAISYEDPQWGRSGAGNNRGSSGTDGRDRFARGGNGNSYGRYDYDGRMMPRQEW